MSDFEIWTDGGCAPKNPGIGGYGIIIVDNASKEKREIKQGLNTLQTTVWNYAR